jgi:hypothetical protein
MARMALISPSSSIILALTFLNQNESNKQMAIPQRAPVWTKVCLSTLWRPKKMSKANVICDFGH